jgi:hypothetical protein
MIFSQFSQFVQPNGIGAIDAPIYTVRLSAIRRVQGTEVDSARTFLKRR